MNKEDTLPITYNMNKLLQPDLLQQDQILLEDLNEKKCFNLANHLKKITRTRDNR